MKTSSRGQASMAVVGWEDAPEAVLAGPRQSASASASCLQLTNDGNVEITGRDLREKTPPVG